MVALLRSNVLGPQVLCFSGISQFVGMISRNILFYTGMEILTTCCHDQVSGSNTNIFLLIGEDTRPRKQGQEDARNNSFQLLFCIYTHTFCFSLVNNLYSEHCDYTAGVLCIVY